MILTQKLSSLETQLNEAQLQNSVYEHEIETLTVEKETAADDVNKVKESLRDAKRQTEIIRQDFNNKDAALEAMTSKFEPLRTRYDEVFDELNQLKALHKAVEDENSHLNERLEKANEEILRLTTLCDTTSQHKDKLVKEVEIHQMKVTNVESTYLDSVEREKDLAFLLEGERDTSANREKEVSEKNEKIKQLESQLEGAQREIDRLEGEMDIAEEKIISLNMEVERISEEKSDEYQRILTAESRVKELETDHEVCLPG